MAIKTFLKSIYFFLFFKLGAGSKPLPPPKNLMGWHFNILFMLRIKPLADPFNFIESIQYSEHVGRYLQLNGK
tara:strand:+ start:120 stop:338 length:219 start_codon:yes stop_codon:yes gene_type:complete